MRSNPNSGPLRGGDEDHAFIVVTHRGIIQFASNGGLHLLRRFFPDARRGECMPSIVKRWLKTERRLHPRPSLLASSNGARLCLRILHPHPRDAFIVTLRVTRRAPSLRARGNGELTAQEFEVVRWIAAGKSNREIALILERSVLTVGKHLEHVYEKLGVENRTSAALWFTGRNAAELVRSSAK